MKNINMGIFYGGIVKIIRGVVATQFMYIIICITCFILAV